MESAPKSKKAPRFYVRKMDFGRGYVIVSNVTGRELSRSWNTHRGPVAAQCARMNAKTR